MKQTVCTLGCFAAMFAALWLAGCYESGNGNEDAVNDPVPDEVTDTIADIGQDRDAVADPDVAQDLDALIDPDGSNEIECQYGAAFVAQFDKSCSRSSDCVIVFFGLDCCGTTLAAGVNASEETRFNEIWAECVMELPMCGCPSGPPVAEDGQSTMNLDDIQVGCLGGTCLTYLPE